MTERRTGRIIRSLSGFYDVQTDSGVVTCRGRGSLRKNQETPLTGDLVEITVENGKGMVEKMAAFKDYKDAEVIVSHCQNPAGAEKLKALILETLPVKSVDLQECRGLNTFYAMDQGIIVSG